MLRQRLFFAAILGACLIAPCTRASADTNTFSVQFSLASLPSTITLCRDSAAIQAFGVDEEWLAGIDVDGNASTGDPTNAGVDVLLFIETAQQSAPCSPISASTTSSLMAGMAVWDNAQQAYALSAVQPTLDINLATKTLTVSAPMSGPLAKLSVNSKIYPAADGGYSGGMGVQVAYDNTQPLNPPATASDPSNDVQGCSSPCGTGVSWYGLIDLTGVTLSTAPPLPMFGTNTVYVEFDVANLPASMSLCRFPETSTFADSDWAALIDVDGNTNTGLNGFDAIVEVYTVAQDPSCMPNSVPLDQALQGEAGHWDDAQQNFIEDTALMVYADAATGRIIVQADRSQAPLTGLSNASRFGVQATGAYPSGNSQPVAYDIIPLTAFGLFASDPTGDVQNCVSPCSPAASWYGQIDLVGASMHLQDEVFGDSFE